MTRTDDDFRSDMELIDELRKQVYELERFRGDVMAGCDIQRGDTLYRQVPVVIGPGVTREQLRIRELEDQLDKVFPRAAIKWPMKGA